VLAIAEDEKAGNINVDYHILLSPTYQVPVVYFAPTWMDEEGTPLTLKEVYTFIVDVSSKEAIEDVGVMGGLSHGVWASQIFRLTAGPPTPGNTILLHSPLSNSRPPHRHLE